MMKVLLVGIMLGSSCCIAQETKETATNETAAVVREWTAVSGAKIKAEFVSKKNGTIELKIADGKQKGQSVFIKESALSDNDKTYLKDKPDTGESDIGKKEKTKKYPSEAKEYKGHHYLFVAEKLTWKDAKKACEDKGGHLLTIGDVYELESIKTFYEESGASLSWVGLAAQSWHNNKFVKTKNAGGVKEYPLTGTDFKWVDNKPGLEAFSKDVKHNFRANELRDVHVFIHQGKLQYELPPYAEHPLLGYICEWDE